MNARERFGKSVDSVRRVSAVGVRCVDAFTGTPVSAGLEVRLHSAALSEARRPEVGPSGIFSFHGLPGMIGAERPDSGAPIPGEGTIDFVLTVRDPGGGYLPTSLGLSLPLEDRLVELPLFGGAAYARPPGWAEVRGRLAQWTGSGALPDPAAAPASWARIEVSVDGSPAVVTFSDARGEFAAVFAYPDLLEPAEPEDEGDDDDDPPDPVVSPRALSWPVELRVQFDPADRGLLEDFEGPELTRIRNQTSRTLITGMSSDAVPVPEPAAAWQGTLKYEALTRVTTDELEALYVGGPVT
jgi:hypothetical protein